MKSIKHMLGRTALMLAIFASVSFGLGFGVGLVDDGKASADKLKEVLTHLSEATSPLPQKALAGALTDYGENKLIDALLRAQAIGTPATWYARLDTTTCTDAGPGTEVSTSGTAYTRQAITAALASWAGTQSAGSTVASSGTGGTTSNNNAITWSASTAAWGNIQSVKFSDASTAGNTWVCIDLTAPLNVSGTGFTVSFAAAALTFQIDN